MGGMGKNVKFSYKGHVDKERLTPSSPCLASAIILFIIVFRLAERCGTLVGEIGEDEIYEAYRKHKSLTNFLCKEQSKDCVKTKKDEL